MMYKKIMVCLLFAQQMSYAGESPEGIEAFNMVEMNDDDRIANAAQIGLYGAYMSGQMNFSDAVRSMVTSGTTTVVSGAQSAFSSAKNTANNALYDTSALAKLGYPSSPVNDTELARFVAIKDRYVRNIFAYNKNENFESDKAFIGRRMGYLQRAINLVDGRPDGIELAFFCLNNYKTIMTFFDTAVLCKFIQLKQASLEKGAGLLFNNLENVYAQEREVPAMPIESQILQAAMYGFDMSSIILQSQQQNEEKEEEKDDLYEYYLASGRAIDEQKREERQLRSKNMSDADAH